MDKFVIKKKVGDIFDTQSSVTYGALSFSRNLLSISERCV